MSDLKIFAKTLEESALLQIEEISRQEIFKNTKIRIMPDAHAGKGCVIGFTAQTCEGAIPNLVGVDIACGMLVVPMGHETNYDFDTFLPLVDDIIRKYVPSGRNVHENLISNADTRYIESTLLNLHCLKDLTGFDRIMRSLGTLGGGNHFIEIDRDMGGYLYLIIHTGSRNLGKQVAEIYQWYAELEYKKEIRKTRESFIKNLKEAGKHKEIEEKLQEFNKKMRETETPKDLLPLKGVYYYQYLNDMEICGIYADFNRLMIAKAILQNLNPDLRFDLSHTCTVLHNYIDSTGMIRKGAISAKCGEAVLIPINMKDGCIFGIGKENSDWNFSAPHGAGRLMSRAKAREELSVGEFQNSMKGIYSTSIGQSTLDESPMAYKPMQEILDAIQDTVDVKGILKPIYNFKATQ